MFTIRQIKERDEQNIPNLLVKDDILPRISSLTNKGEFSYSSFPNYYSYPYTLCYSGAISDLCTLENVSKYVQTNLNLEYRLCLTNLMSPVSLWSLHWNRFRPDLVAARVYTYPGGSQAAKCCNIDIYMNRLPMVVFTISTGKGFI